MGSVACCSTDHIFIVICMLQNASLAVLTDCSIWSQPSSDSWGHTPSDAGTGHPPLECSPLETWLMLEYCDQGSLLVSALTLLHFTWCCLSGNVINLSDEQLLSVVHKTAQLTKRSCALPGYKLTS